MGPFRVYYRDKRHNSKWQNSWTEIHVVGQRPSITEPTADIPSRGFEHFKPSPQRFVRFVDDIPPLSLSSLPLFFLLTPLSRPPPRAAAVSGQAGQEGGGGKMMMTRAPMGPMEGAAVDEVVRRLVEGGRGGRQVQLSEAEIRQLCVEGKRVLLSQPNLLRIHAPVKICGNPRLSPLSLYLSIYLNPASLQTPFVHTL